MGDHPRLRGENLPSPLVCLCYQGITPAYAGKTAAIDVPAPQAEDHPRLRGENIFRNSYSSTF